ncbi:MAG: leucine-rich repeat domain-containing protein [Treponema sp.]|nr:leucine-rich repeat domain-containing protein [Treponema sp.]
MLFFFGCPADPEDPTTPTTPTTPETPAIYTLAELAESLSESPNGSAGNPVAVKVAMNLADDWEDILTAIKAAGKYVALDLSACTMSGTEFDPGTADTGKDKIVSLVLPAAAESIKDGSAVIEDETVSDVYPTFEHFSALKEIHGSNIESIGDLAFYECSALTTADFPKAIEIGDAAFYECSALTTVDFPEATSIGDFAFAYCSTLATADFPEATSIGDGAFYGSALATVNIPKAITIGDYAFTECIALTTVSFPEATSIGDNAFSYTGNTPLEIKLGAKAPTVGIKMFYSSSSWYSTAGKPVTVKVPHANATAWENAGYNAEWKASFKGSSSIELTIETL